jgi:lipopolysaccharide transport system ATP-binding protein
MAGEDIVIQVDKLSKSYLIGHRAESSTETFREMLGRRTRRATRGLRDIAAGRQIVGGDDIEEFWAIKDVSFDVRRGEAMGVIGRNGAGKSTLLKVLSRVTEPTGGRVTIRGRVASLLEVGTGFHPELTGRENIFLNGAILGMSRSEIKSKFDEIVDFAEVGKFLDTPVKRYSSGMYVRLAFAVAAHLEPEILIVDEVLAVGDIAFQKKCLGKMRSVANEGRTVLFVSHNIPAVLELTQRAVMLEHGRVTVAGRTGDIVSAYLRNLHQASDGANDLGAYRTNYRKEGFVDIENVRVDGLPPGAAVTPFGKGVIIEIDLLAHRPIEQGIVNINILNDQLEIIATVMSADAEYYYGLGPGRLRIQCDVGRLPLLPGDYLLNVGVAETGGGLAWDVLKTLPGFRIDGSENPVWLREPVRPGAVFIDDCKWISQ